MLMTTESSFIDTNIFLYALAYQKEDILTWIDSVYRNIYVHIDVLEELEIYTERTRIEAFIVQHNWTLFDPGSLPERDYEMYSLLRSQVADNMLALTENRRNEGLAVKHTANTGEISILAACLLINGNIICSNDGDVRDVIAQEQYQVLDMATQQDRPIRQEDLVDLCVKAQSAGIAKRKAVRKFYGAIIGNRKDRGKLLQVLDKRLIN